MRIAIVENTRITQHGQVGVALHEAAATIDLYKPWADQRLPWPGSYDALVVFGGEQSAMDDAIHPYLPRLADLMASSAQGGTSVLGICLGSQLLARGLGATPSLGSAAEFGWCEVERLAEDPVLAALPRRFPSFQWHDDTHDLPPGSEHLATSAVAPVQCYRVGRAGYGMQFHFEASRAVVAEWTREFPEQIEPISPGWTAALPDRAAREGVAADAHGLDIARAWVATI